ncbi:MAG: hypothetical protein ACTSWP_12145 [Candidatus Freyarchaeota archaeon]
MPDGLLYRVSGSYAVEKMGSGRRYLAGADEPEKLAELVDNRLRWRTKNNIRVDCCGASHSSPGSPNRRRWA